MRTHRSMAAVCALLALAVSFAETARAPLCEAMPADMPSHGQHDMPAPDQPASECPLGMAWQSCTAPASLPASDLISLDAPASEQPASIYDVILPHSLRTSTIFHPPRA